MNFEFKLKNVEEIQATMTITMNVAQWILLKEQLSRKFPAWEFASAISRLISRAKESYSERVDNDDYLWDTASD